MEQQTFGVAFTAFGMSGRVFHGPLVSAEPGLRLVGAAERSKHQLNQYYPEAKRYSSLTELLADDAVHLVVVNTPQALHYDQCKQALSAGKHVVVEKPAALTLAQCKDLMALADAKGLVFQVFQNRRWDADFLTIQRLMNLGKLEGLTYFESTFNRFRPVVDHSSWKEQPEEGSGLLYNLGPHLIDQALVLFGRPVSVWAHLETERKGAKVIDYFHLVLRYPTGLTTHLRSSYHVAGPIPRFTLHGSFGSYIKYGLDVQEAQLNQGLLPGDAAWGWEPESANGTLYPADAAGKLLEPLKIPSLQGDYAMYYRGLCDRLCGKATAGIQDGFPFMAIEIIEAAYQSNNTGQVITMS